MRLELGPIKLAWEPRQKDAGGQVSLSSSAGWEPVQAYWNSMGSVGKRIPRDPAKLIEHYRSTIYACASRNAAALAAVPIRLYAKDRSGGTRQWLQPVSKVDKRRKAYLRKAATSQMGGADDVVEVLEHPILDLLNTANAEENGFDALFLLSIFLDMTGRSFWLLDGMSAAVPSLFYTLPSQYTSPKRDKQTRAIQSYEVGVGANRVTYPADEVIMFKQPSPITQLEGYGAAHAAYGDAQTQSAIEEWEEALFANKAAPGSILAPDAPITAEQWTTFKDYWESNYSGVKNAGKSVFANIPLKLLHYAISPKDLNHMAGREYTRKQIANAMGVPMTMLDLEQARASAEQGNASWLANTIRPRCRLIESVLNAKLVPRYASTDIFIAFDDPVPEQQTYNLHRATRMASTDGVFYVNEVRGAFDSDPLPEFDGVIHARPVAPAPQMALEPTRALSHGVKALPEHVEPYTALQRAIRQAFAMQRETVLAAIAKGYNGIRRKGPQDLREINIEEWTVTMEQLAEPHIRTTMGAGYGAGARRVPTSVGLTFDISNPHIAEFLAEYTHKFSFAVNQGTQDQLTALLTDSMMSGDTVADITGRVNDLFDGMEKYRAARIARTEVARSQSAGQDRAFRDSGVVTGTYWRVFPGSCEFCEEMGRKYGPDSGAYTPLGGTFAKQGDVVEAVDPDSGNVRQMSLNYSDIPYPPLHPNCRCDRELVLEGE